MLINKSTIANRLKDIETSTSHMRYVNYLNVMLGEVAAMNETSLLMVMQKAPTGDTYLKLTVNEQLSDTVITAIKYEFSKAGWTRIDHLCSKSWWSEDITEFFFYM